MSLWFHSLQVNSEVGEVSKDLQVERLTSYLESHVKSHFPPHRNARLTLYNIISLNSPQQAVSWGCHFMAAVL